MRPVRLELQGFTAFRDPTEVDFGDAGLFAFTGPTGSGKSSLIDAMVFALYGSVPRYDDRRSVEPVVSLGREEARVRFDFTVGGQVYTAVRVVRRNERGATTAEARLETDGEVPVAGAKEVTEAVERLLGLGFDHFTKCVVLPQGDFAEFLHDTGKGRRELLKKLLDLDVYAAVRSAASSRAKQAGDEARWIEERRAELAAGADEEAARSAAERLSALEALRDRVATEEPALAKEEALAGDLEAKAKEAATRVSALAAIAVPDGLEETIDAVRSARAAFEEANAALTAAEEALTDAVAAREALPPGEVLEARRARHAERADLVERRERGAEVTESAVGRLESATAAVAEAVRSVDAAREVLRTAERSHLAHVLGEGLSPGDACPVCGRPVDEPPEVGVPAALDAARAAVEEAERRRREAEGERSDAAVHLERCRSTAESVEERLAAIGRELGDESPVDVDRRIALAREADERIAATRRARDEARTRRTEAERLVESAQRSLASSWTAYDAARDTVAGSGPPAPDRDDLAGSWETLAGWAAEQATDAGAAASKLSAEAEAAVRAVSERRTALRALLLDAGVDPGDRASIEAVATAVADARHEHDRILRARQEAEALAERIRAAEEREAVAKGLAYHLDGRRFEAWLLEEAFGALVDGANRRLDDLTGGAYSLALEDQSFVVVDHRNADQRRGVKTLSGGETFLVSLALALALSEQLSELAVEGAARLESIFLDEGFGTLDGETLDLVASVLDELGASGRTVGIVTHVTELAERLPVRFEVQKVGPTAGVRRVEA